MNANRIRHHLERTRASLEAALGEVSAENWRQAPAPGRWSAAEVVVHLTMIETRVQQGARKVLSHEPRAVPIWKRAHIPTRIVAWRSLRRVSPVHLDPTLLAEKAESLERHRACRQVTLELLVEQARAGDRGHRWAHPFLGHLSLEKWLWMLGYHEVRHTKQIREIVASFQR